MRFQKVCKQCHRKLGVLNMDYCEHCMKYNVKSKKNNFNNIVGGV